jgi:hypothetical protein
MYSRANLLSWFYENDEDTSHKIFTDFSLDHNSFDSHTFEMLKWMYEKRDNIKINYTGKYIDDVLCYDVTILDWFIDSELEFMYEDPLTKISGNDSYGGLQWWYDKYKCGRVGFPVRPQAFDYCHIRRQS